MNNATAPQPPPGNKSWASKVRSSKSFNLPFSMLAGVAMAAQHNTGMPRTGRGAKLPVVPGTVPAVVIGGGPNMMRTRPDRLATQSR